ncbi:Galactosylxylosylprotein 3-beta-galactosyltransferase [Bertholletia excelsa]
MTRGNFDLFVSLSRHRSIQILTGVGLLYIVMVTLEFPFVFRTGFGPVTEADLTGFSGEALTRSFALETDDVSAARKSPVRPRHERRIAEYRTLSTLTFDVLVVNNTGGEGLSGIQRLAMEAFESGKKLWDELQSGKVPESMKKATENNRTESCPDTIVLSGSGFTNRSRILVLPCGMTLGSHITLVGKPREAHLELEPKISLLKEGQYGMVSQFVMELQGLKAVDGEDPPRILHVNPRLKGDWDGKPVIELNTRYRMKWGTAQRCEGWKSSDEEETVDGHVKCEKWLRDDNNHTDESKVTWWLNRLMGRTKKVTVDWPYPFVEERLFVLTLSADMEGFHIHVDGRHVASFPYRTGFSLEDATGLSLTGDVDVHSIFAASLPTSHSSFAPQRFLDMSTRWQAPPLPDKPVELFIGILSAGNHFGERMAVRKSWMQHSLIKSSIVVPRFFVALHHSNDINVEMKKEAEFFGDIVIVPYADNYDLVFLKTLAICEYVDRIAPAKHIMKCDDDTFVRVDVIMNEIKKVPDGQSFYMGNINFKHKALRRGKWAVTYEEWPEKTYPPYANGPGYIVSSDIAHFIISEYKKHKLRLFKMEDVSVAMWVGKFNISRPVAYIHSSNFCQYGCKEDYYTAHYQSPMQMICLWNKLQLQGRAQCCDIS